jgi:hypothetical protein
MRFASSWSEVALLVMGVVGLLGLRVHWTCNIRKCWRHELAPTGRCRKHQSLVLSTQGAAL